MPWSKSKTLDSLKNKSTKAKEIFAEVANDAMQKGRTEQEAIFAGLAAVTAYEKEQKKLKKQAEEVQKAAEAPKALPKHLQAVLDAQELKKQREQEYRKQVEEEIKKELYALPDTPWIVDVKLVGTNLVVTDSEKRQKKINLEGALPDNSPIFIGGGGGGGSAVAGATDLIVVGTYADLLALPSPDSNDLFITADTKRAYYFALGVFYEIDRERQEFANEAAFPLVGKVDYEYVSLATDLCYRWDGTKYVRLNVPDEVNIATGFVDRSQSEITFNEVTRVFTIAPKAPAVSYKVFLQGKRVLKTASESLTLPNTTGGYFLYFDKDTAALSFTNTFTEDIITKHAVISFVNYNAAQSQAVIFAEERHGLDMDGGTHLHLHMTIGAQYVSGLALLNLSVEGTGDLDADAQFGAQAGLIRDEDIALAIGNTALQDIMLGQYRPLYRVGNSEWRIANQTNFPVLGAFNSSDAVGTRLNYNKETSPGVWQVLEAANNDFVLCHILATNDVRYPIAAIVGGSYLTINQARDAALKEFQSFQGLPFQEFVPIATVVFETADAYTNTVKARTRRISADIEYIDLRTSRSFAAGNSTMTQVVQVNTFADLALLPLKLPSVIYYTLDKQRSYFYDQTLMQFKELSKDEGPAPTRLIANEQIVYPERKQVLFTEEIVFEPGSSLVLGSETQFIQVAKTLAAATGSTVTAYANITLFPAVGAPGNLYIAKNSQKIYYYDAGSYREIAPSNQPISSASAFVDNGQLIPSGAGRNALTNYALVGDYFEIASGSFVAPLNGVYSVVASAKVLITDNPRNSPFPYAFELDQSRGGLLVKYHPLNTSVDFIFGGDITNLDMHGSKVVQAQAGDKLALVVQNQGLAGMTVSEVSFVVRLEKTL